MKVNKQKPNELDLEASALFARLSPGDLVLLGARPGHGKTQLSLKLAVEAMKSGKVAVVSNTGAGKFLF